MNSTQVHNQLFHHGPVVMFVWKNEPYWPVEEVSGNLQQLYGYDPQEYIRGTLHYSDQIHPEDLERVTHEVLQASTNPQCGAFVHQPYRYRDANGTYRWVKDATTLLRDEYGRVTHYIGYIIDISDEKAKEERLEQTKEEFETIFRIAKDGIALLDLESRFLDCNEAYLEMTGLSREELLRHSCIEMSIPEDRHRAEEAFRMVATMGALTHFEKTCVMAGGRYLTVNMAMTLMPDKQRVLIVAKDVSDQKRNEAALLRAKEEAEHANRVKSAFLANISHEIRTPLNGIMGLTELVLKTPLSATQHEYLIKARRSSEALLIIINDMLDYSKIEAGKMTLESIGFDLRDVLQTIHDVFEYQALEKGITLQVHLEENLPRRVQGDPLRLTQVLNNLVGNALKFTERGSVKLSIHRLGEDRYCFEVRDSGIGISAEQQRRLFRPFEQVDSSTTRKYGGTGLGLMIAKQLIELMGGSISLKSVYGMGSRFRFELTLVEAPDLGVIRSEMVIEGKGSILVVEDHPINQVVIRDHLLALGLKVHVASEGSEALEMVARHPFDLILMDLHMPIMDGFTTARRIRQNNATIPIIALSAATSPEDQTKSLAAGMNAYLTKPLDIDKLKNLLIQYVPTIDIMVTSYEIDRVPLLHLFALEYHDFAVQLRQCGVGDESFNHLIHTLKGVSGNLRLDALYQMAKKIDEAPQIAKAGLVEPLIEVFEQTYATLPRDESVEEHESVGSLEECVLLFETLIHALEMGKFLSDEEISTAISHMYHYGGEEKAHQLNQHFLLFDYNDATKMLDQAVKELRGQT